MNVASMRRASSVSITKAKCLVCLLVACGIVVQQIGCNQRSTYQVSGKVRYKDGSPITGGAACHRIRANGRVPRQRSASRPRSQIAEDGSFQMYTRKPGDGVIPGKYAVSVCHYGQADRREDAHPAKNIRAQPKRPMRSTSMATRPGSFMSWRSNSFHPSEPATLFLEFG